MAEEGFSFDPANKGVIPSNTIRPVKTSNKNFDLSLDDIISQQRKERIEERKNQSQDEKRPAERRRSLTKRGNLPRVSRSVKTSRLTRLNNLARRKSTPNFEPKRRTHDSDNQAEKETTRKDNKPKERPRQIEVPEESLRKFLRGEGIKMDKNYTYKIMSYPKE